MADFVNYNKRDIDLPAGCKDLMDVLKVQAREPEEVPRRKMPAKAFAIGQSSNLQMWEPLSALGKLVERFYQQGSGVLWIGSPELQLSARFMKVLNNVTVSVDFQQGSPHEPMIRDFLKKRGLNPPSDSGTPKAFFPSLPVEIMCTLSPLPAEPAEVSRLLLDLFHALGLKDNTPMSYRVTWSKDIRISPPAPPGISSA